MKSSIISSSLAIGLSMVFGSGVMAQQKSVTPTPATAAPTPAPESRLEKFRGVIWKVDTGTKRVVVLGIEMAINRSLVGSIPV